MARDHGRALRDRAEAGYMIRVARFAALGFTLNDFRVHAHDLPEGIGVDELLGLSFCAALGRPFRHRRSASPFSVAPGIWTCATFPGKVLP